MSCVLEYHTNIHTYIHTYIHCWPVPILRSPKCGSVRRRRGMKFRYHYGMILIYICMYVCMYGVGLLMDRNGRPWVCKTGACGTRTMSKGEFPYHTHTYTYRHSYGHITYCRFPKTIDLISRLSVPSCEVFFARQGMHNIPYYVCIYVCMYVCMCRDHYYIVST